MERENKVTLSPFERQRRLIEMQRNRAVVPILDVAYKQYEKEMMESFMELEFYDPLSEYIVPAVDHGRSLYESESASAVDGSSFEYEIPDDIPVNIGRRPRSSSGSSEFYWNHEVWVESVLKVRILLNKSTFYKLCLMNFQ